MNASLPIPEPAGVIAPDTQIACLRYSPCGRFLLAATYEGRVLRWKTNVPDTPPEPLPEVTGHHGFVSRIVFHPWREIAFSADSWGALRAWPYAAGRPEPFWSCDEAHDGWIRDLAISRDGEWLATCGRDRTIRVFSVVDGREIACYRGHSSDIQALAIHPDGQSVVSADLLGNVIQIRVTDGSVLREYPGREFHLLDRVQDVGGIRRLLFSPDGARLFVAGGIPSSGGFLNGHARLKWFDTASGAILGDVAVGVDKQDVFIHDAHFHRAGFLSIVTSGQPGQGSLFLHRPGDDEPTFKLSKGTVNCRSLAVSPDETRLAVAATNTGSNGNGKRLDGDGNYVGNHSPIHLFRLAATAS